MAVSSGLFNFLTQNSAAAAVQAILSQLPSVNGVPQFPVYVSRADKEPPANYIVIHTIDAPPAAHSLDGPSGLSDGEFQFDSCAADQLTAQLLSNAVKAALSNFGGTLSDGTTIQFYKITLDADEPYEVGGGGYVFRRCLRLAAFYTEEATAPPSPGGGVTLYTLTPTGNPQVWVSPVAVSANALLFRNGELLLQGASLDYTVAGTNVTFAPAIAPASGDNLALFQ